MVQDRLPGCADQPGVGVIQCGEFIDGINGNKPRLDTTDDRSIVKQFPKLNQKILERHTDQNPMQNGKQRKEVLLR